MKKKKKRAWFCIMYGTRGGSPRQKNRIHNTESWEIEKSHHDSVFCMARRVAPRDRKIQNTQYRIKKKKKKSEHGPVLCMAREGWLPETEKQNTQYRIMRRNKKISCSVWRAGRPPEAAWPAHFHFGSRGPAARRAVTFFGMDNGIPVSWKEATALKQLTHQSTMCNS